MSKNEFEELFIPRWKITAHEAAGKTYRVFKGEEDFDEVAADSANEAIQKSGLEDAYMVKSGTIDDMAVFDQTMLVADEVAEAAMEATEESEDEASEEGDSAESSEEASADTENAEEATEESQPAAE